MPNKPSLIETVYQSHVEKLYRFFYFKVLDKQTAEDLTSETFIALAEKIDGLGKDNNVIEKYLYGIARNKWNGYLREKYKNEEYSVEHIENFAGYVEDEVAEINQLSLKERAIKFINMLPPKQKIVAMLRLIDGFTPSEIAVKIKKPINYVKVTLRRALRRLEELIASSSIPDPNRSKS